jgi:predicted nucleotidyltransferase
MNETRPEQDRWIQIRHNREHSKRILSEVAAELEKAKLNGVLTVAIAGSFGRLEASESSDADFIVVLANDGESNTEESQEEKAREVYATVAAPFVSRGIEEPNPAGVFARARRLDELVPAADTGGIGQAQEQPDVMGKRLLLLLESQPLWNPSGYTETIDAVFDRYAAHVRTEPGKEFVLLLNDLIRYFRYICVNYESTFGTQSEKWALRNVKLRHSRMLMYFGLLVLLGEASAMGADEAKVDFVRKGLDRTPIDRMELAYNRAADTKLGLALGLYNTFLEHISDPSLRTILSAIDYDNRYESPDFARLKANSDAFLSELARFCYGQRGRWSDRFFEYLLF